MSTVSSRDSGHATADTAAEPRELSAADYDPSLDATDEIERLRRYGQADSHRAVTKLKDVDDMFALDEEVDLTIPIVDPDGALGKVSLCAE